jgi:hypothetical protein
MPCGAAGFYGSGRSVQGTGTSSTSIRFGVDKEVTVSGGRAPHHLERASVLGENLNRDHEVCVTNMLVHGLNVERDTLAGGCEMVPKNVTPLWEQHCCCEIDRVGLPIARFPGCAAGSPCYADVNDGASMSPWPWRNVKRVSARIVPDP